MPPAAGGPGLDRLGELAEPVRAAGLAVAVRREGLDGLVLPAAVDRSAYRIVQEALTNTLRHAGATRAWVTLRATGGTLEVEVRDDGHGGAVPATAATGGCTGGGLSGVAGGGRGLVGMRERAAMLGGTVEAGPQPGGGFRVRARLPLERTR